MERQDRFEAAQSAEGRYRMLVEAVTDYAIYMLNTEGLVSSWNPGARRFKGYEESEIIGEHFSRFYTDKDRATGLPKRALETAEREGKFEAEGWRVRKDGSRFWAYVIIDPIRDSNGRLLGYAKVTRDLTERRAAEAELRKSQEQFQLLVQGVTDYAIYLLTPQGNVSSWNSGAERIKGYKTGRDHRPPFFDLIRPKTARPDCRKSHSKRPGLQDGSRRKVYESGRTVLNFL